MNVFKLLAVVPILVALSGCETTAPKAAPALRARYLVTVADDFIVDVYRNGQKIDDSSRTLLGELFGATVERIDVPLFAGDWVVFNVVNNRMRWNGSYYFAAAGMLGPDRIGFTSSLSSGDWSACDSPAEAARFIARRNFGRENPALEISRLWGDGDRLIKQNAGLSWKGDPLWGRSRNTWIKVVVP